MEIVVVAVVAIAIVVIALSIYFGLIKRNSIEVSMIIRNGTYVKGKKNSSAASSYFKGNMKPSDTVLVNGRANIGSTWNIELYDLESGEVQKFSFQQKLYIGRSKDNVTDVMMVILDPLVSKQHCIIYESNGRLMIVDLGSKNHTFWNGKQIEAAVHLKSDDVLQVGNTKLKIHF